MHSRPVFIAPLPVIAAALLVSAAPSNSKANRLIDLLGIEPGMAVAEIGAGDGDLSVEIARELGAAGHMYSTEVSEKRLTKMRENVSDAGLENVTIIKGEDTDTKLPVGCCDVIYMETVYHHFTDPGAMDASLFAAMKPGGRLAVIDFPPRHGSVDGVPESRGGHGMPINLLIKELEAAGFELSERIEDWGGREYCIVFRKPASSDS